MVVLGIWRLGGATPANREWPSEGHTRPWPGDIVMSPEVKARIDSIWKQLGIE